MAYNRPAPEMIDRTHVNDTVGNGDISLNDLRGTVSRADESTSRIGRELEWFTSSRGVVGRCQLGRVSDRPVDDVVGKDGQNLGVGEISNRGGDGLEG